MQQYNAGEIWYLVGIKGVGMTALVKILQHRGVKVAGSDTHEEFFTDSVLAHLGISVDGFETSLPEKMTGLIYSAAYDELHPQIIAARKKNVPCLSYTEALGEVSAQYYAVGIAGTHGKTTISAWLGFALWYAGADPTVVVGSMVPQFDNSNSLVGASDILIAETCEYRRHFLNFNPDIILISNIEMDHPDYFSDLNDVQRAFQEYCDTLPENGILIRCLEDMDGNAKGESVQTGTQALVMEGRETVAYGRAEQADWHLVSNHSTETGQKITIEHRNKDSKLELMIGMLGAHNALNATGVIAAGYVLHKKFGFSWKKFLEGVCAFNGTKRRMEKIGQYGEITIYDDYAHHPTEIRVTLRTLREQYEDSHLIAVFMPHTFSRTELLFDEFVESFGEADETIILPVYGSAREKGDTMLLSKKLAEAIEKKHGEGQFFADFEHTVEYLKTVKTKTVLVTLGAGDSWQVGTLLREA